MNEEGMEDLEEVGQDDLAALRQSFESCDSDSDGWIAVKEFGTLLQSLDQDLSEAECLLAFEVTDDDGDGLISFEEFIGWWSGD